VLLLGCLRIKASQLKVNGNNAFIKLMFSTHYDIDHRDCAVQYMRKNALVSSNGASTDSIICASKWKNGISCA